MLSVLRGEGSVAPIVREFQKAGEKTGATREQRKALSGVCDELAEAFREDRSWPRSPSVEHTAERGDLDVDPPVLSQGGRKRSHMVRAGGNGAGRRAGKARPERSLTLAPRAKTPSGASSGC